jgi:hypothetical protein
VIGIDTTPFSHKYLKKIFGSENTNPGIMKSPYTLVLYTVFGFLSPPTVTLQTHVSVILPTLNEFALNYIGIPIFGLRIIVSGTTAYTNLTSSSFYISPYETIDASIVPVFFTGDSTLVPSFSFNLA